MSRPLANLIVAAEAVRALQSSLALHLRVSDTAWSALVRSRDTDPCLAKPAAHQTPCAHVVLGRALVAALHRRHALLVMLGSGAGQSVRAVLLVVRAVSTLEDTAHVRLALETLSTLPVRFDPACTPGLHWLLALLMVRRTNAVKSMRTLIRLIGTFTTLFDTANIVLSTDKSMIAHPPRFDSTGTTDLDWLLATLVVLRPDALQPLCAPGGIISTFLALGETALVMLAFQT